MSEYVKVKPRYEFRTFATSFDEKTLDLVRNQHANEGFRQSEEVYIMSTGNNVNNTKLRDNKMDIKCFVENKDGFEQWNPLAKFSFPLAATRIKDELFPAFSVACPTLERSEYTQDQFLTEIIDAHAYLSGARIQKRRFATTICNCIAEYAEVLINGAPLVSISIESTEIDDLNAAKDLLALGRFENINYLVATKRVIGMLRKDQE
jgi:hypothetical protein